MLVSSIGLFGAAKALVAVLAQIVALVPTPLVILFGNFLLNMATKVVHCGSFLRTFKIEFGKILMLEP